MTCSKQHRLKESVMVCAHRLPAKKDPWTLPDMREAVEGAREMLNTLEGLRPTGSTPDAAQVVAPPGAPVAAPPTAKEPEAVVPACEGE